MAGTVNTAVEMANLALAHLKEPAIRDFDFSSVASRWMRNHYAAHRDAYQAMHDWDFATRLVSLPAETTAPPFRWAFSFKKPADCLRIPQQTVDGNPGGQLIPHEVVGQRIMSNYRPPFPFRYIRRVTSEAEFSPLFVNGFGLFLAAGCAHVITGKNSRAEALRQAATEALVTASKTDAQQGTPLPMVDLHHLETGRASPARRHPVRCRSEKQRRSVLADPVRVRQRPILHAGIRGLLFPGFHQCWTGGGCRGSNTVRESGAVRAQVRAVH